MEIPSIEHLGIYAPLLITAGYYFIFSLGLQLQAGYGGLINFGQVGYMAIGAYTMAVCGREGVPLAASIVLAIVMPMVAAVIIGLATLRLREDFLAIVAIASAEIIRRFAQNSEFLEGPRAITGGGVFKEEITRPLLRWLRDSGWDVDRALPLLVIVWVTALVLAVTVWALVRTPWGRVLKAVREDEDAVRALGKNAFVYKLQALALGAALAGVAGILFAADINSFSHESFRPIVTFIGFVILILGGLGSIRGTLVAALIVQALFVGTRFIETGLSNSQEAALRFLVVGLALMLLVALRPQGLFGKRREMVLGD